ncbi:zinc ribbon domain-containing protein [Candidatus Methylomirabilis sp.]|uniref:Zinc ribbon domain-containing protein n=1 Tax=Candidatus Methylomirabilis tolerans TaxID=3123416 RepID=A0AAJ1EIL4_9BACT|nr:zinc ribbon domain-containing protein [Candidatus Methylomirabilis sp.]
MPIYEYRCTSCDQVFEKLVLSHDVIIECPHCPGAAVEKQLSAFSFKGERKIIGSGTLSNAGSGCAPSG